jgi:hypothetical protein
MGRCSQGSARFGWRRATTGQNGGGGENLENKKAREGRKAAIAELLREAAGMPDLLAMRRKAMAVR